MAANLLTPRQKKALLLFAFQFTHQQIGEHIGASKDTAKNEVLAAYRVLQVNCLVMALLVAIVLNEITVEDIKFYYYSLPKP